DTNPRPARQRQDHRVRELTHVTIARPSLAKVARTRLISVEGLSHSSEKVSRRDRSIIKLSVKRPGAGIEENKIDFVITGRFQDRKLLLAIESASSGTLDDYFWSISLHSVWRRCSGVARFLDVD